MSDLEQKNKNEKIMQQKHKFLKRLILCVAFIVVISVIFVVVMNNQRGTEITVNEVVQQLESGQIQEIQFNQERIQIYYNNGEAHWIYNRDNIEELIRDKWENLPDEMIQPRLVSGTTTTVSIISILYPILMAGLFIAIAVLVIRQLKGANNKSFEFVKNRHCFTSL